MKRSTLLLTFSGLVFTNPIENRQDASEVDAIYAAYEAVPDVPAVAAPMGEPPAPVPSYNPSAIIVNTNSKRDGCVLDLTSNYAGSVSPDTDAAFLNDATIAHIATTVTQPAGYFLVSGFKNLQASAQDGSYMTYWASQIQSYDVNACAAGCSSITGCNGFNIYFERDPKYHYDPNGCPDSTSVSSTLIKCAFFGAPLTVASATNIGQVTGVDGFHVVIAGSNAYTITPQPQPGYDGPYNFNNACISSPSGSNTYMGIVTFPGTQPYDPAVCAAGCLEKTAFNSRHPNPDGSYRKCVFFNAYMMYKNGINGQFTCTYYTAAFDSHYATNVGQTRSSGVYTIGHSNAYKISDFPFYGP